MLNRISDTFHQIAGGALGWDCIILTGGGSGLLYNRLLPILKHKNIILADDIEAIHMANVQCGLKLWRLFEVSEVL